MATATKTKREFAHIAKELIKQGLDLVASNCEYKNTERWDLKGYEGVIYIDIYDSNKADVFSGSRTVVELNFDTSYAQEKVFKPLKAGGYNYKLLLECIERVKPQAKEIFEKRKKKREAIAHNNQAFSEALKLEKEVNAIAKPKYGSASSLTTEPYDGVKLGYAMVEMGNQRVWVTPNEALAYMKFLKKMAQAGVFARDKN